ncbi:MAG: DUF3108 domain-containing protein [Fulvivirga sp.]|uniref:DUF3108 domain-containing protein n=1 Tax=Fulvivirga sp. TaxID=1931237 RepID=UPI0032EE9248
MKHVLVLGLSLAISLSGFCQENTTIAGGEKLVFNASYSMSGLMTQLAQVTMETADVKTSSATLLHLKCTAVTFSKWDSFFKIRDLYESYVNPKNLKPVMHKRDIEEGTYKKQMKYVFNSKTGTVKITSSKPNKPTKETQPKITPSTIDVVSLLYQVRTTDFSAIPVGGTKSFTLLFDEKELAVNIKLLGKEVMNSGPLGKKECYKLSVSAKTDKLKGKDQNLIWLTTDRSRMPVYMKFNIPVGTGELVLKSVASPK